MICLELKDTREVTGGVFGAYLDLCDELFGLITTREPWELSHLVKASGIAMIVVLPVQILWHLGQLAIARDGNIKS